MLLQVPQPIVELHATSIEGGGAVPELFVANCRSTKIGDSIAALFCGVYFVLHW